MKKRILFLSVALLAISGITSPSNALDLKEKQEASSPSPTKLPDGDVKEGKVVYAGAVASNIMKEEKSEKEYRSHKG